MPGPQSGSNGENTNDKLQSEGLRSAPDASTGPSTQSGEDGSSSGLIGPLEPFLQPGRKQEAAKVIRSMLIQQQMSGPLPAAREFKGYEQTLPGAADRIVSMTEREQAHRHLLEERAFESNRRSQATGQWLAFAALLLSLLVVCFFCLQGHPTQGASLGGAIIVAIVALFLGRRWLPRSQGDDPGPDE